MLLVIDVGNTQTVVGLYDSGDRSHQLLDHWRMATRAERTSDELALFIRHLLATREPRPGHRHPRRRGVLGRAEHHLRAAPHVRALPASSSRSSWAPGSRPACRCSTTTRARSAPTASPTRSAPTTCTAARRSSSTSAPPPPSTSISDKGEYLGGAIFPGIEISMDALFGRAAALRRVELSEPRSVIGKTTMESVQSGAVYGYSAMVDGMCDRIEEVVGEATIIATGGLAVADRPGRRVDRARGAVADPARPPPDLGEEPAVNDEPQISPGRRPRARASTSPTPTRSPTPPRSCRTGSACSSPASRPTRSPRSPAG